MKHIKGPLYFVIGAAALSAIAIPLLPSYYVGLLAQVLIFAIFAMSLDLLVGFVGLPSLGHSAFFGVGAYVAGLLTLKVTHNFWLALFAGVGSALLVGLLFGLLAVRTAGPTFLMITLALSQLLWGIAFKWRSLAGGEDGLPGIARPDLGIGLNITSAQNFCYVVLFIFIFVSIALVLFVKSPFGIALEGIRESESRMRALGYNVWAYKYSGYVFASIVAGFAGVLFVYYNSFVNPNYLSIGLSAKALLMVIVGGTGTLVGAILGSAIVVALENIVSDFTQRWMMIIGAIYVLVVLFFPKGIMGTIYQRKSRAASRELSREGSAAPASAAATEAAGTTAKTPQEVVREAASSR
jgi:branched-chain amino acid transport system permease protein